MKTEIYNLIILDESGSMSCVRKQTIDGCNETLNTIKSAQDMHTDTQDHFVSIYLFQSNFQNPSHYLVQNSPVAMVNHINDELYKPWGGTPLYDAIGDTLTSLKALVDKKPSAIGSVTIITDGYENSSRRYRHYQVAEMIKALKDLGWNFSFIGANIDVEKTASMLNIDNTLEFQQTEEGTRQMFAREAQSRMAYYQRADEVMCCLAPDTSEEERVSQLKKAAKNYFG